MKSFATTTALALAGLSFTLADTHAAAVYNNGDLLLGFRATGGSGATKDYVLNIGPASQFTTTSATFDLNLGNVAGDLSSNSLFGSTWNLRSDVQWGIAGANLAGDPANTLYVTRPENPVGTPAIPWTRRSNSSQGTTNSVLNAFASGYLNSDQNALSPFGTIQDTTFANSYASFVSPGVDFGVYNGIEGNFGDGTSGTAIDLFRLTPTSQAAGDVFLGTFNISDAGVVSFTGSSPVPEPQSLMLLGIGASLLGLVRRRPQIQ